MAKQRQWKDIWEVFKALNETCNYIILRNYEELEKGNMLMDEHDDIDFLCDDQQNMRELLGAVYRPITGNFDHFFISVGGEQVKIGIRYVGDLYYDTEWEQAMLAHRVWNQAGFYVMDEENYFYSLLYHALVQKKKLSEDYAGRLQTMGSAFGVHLQSEEDYVRCLEDYMLEKEYKVCYPVDTTIPFQKKSIQRVEIVGKEAWKKRKKRRIIIRGLRYIYRRIRRH